MQPTPEPRSGLEPPADSGGRALPPLGTFFALLALLASALLLTRALADPPPLAEPLRGSLPETRPTLRPPEQAAAAPVLTRRQAIARYRVLDALRLRAYRTRDVSLFSAYLTPDSGLHEVGRKEIERLRSDGVVMHPRARTRRITIRSLGPERIVVRQVSIQDPRFYSGDRDVTIDPEAKRVTTDWILRPAGGAWKIFNSRVRAVKPLR